MIYPLRNLSHLCLATLFMLPISTTLRNSRSRDANETGDVLLNSSSYGGDEPPVFNDSAPQGVEKTHVFPEKLNKGETQSIFYEGVLHNGQQIPIFHEASGAKHPIFSQRKRNGVGMTPVFYQVPEERRQPSVTHSNGVSASQNRGKRALRLFPVYPMLDATLGMLSYAAFAVYIILLFTDVLRRENPVKSTVSLLKRHGLAATDDHEEDPDPHPQPTVLHLAPPAHYDTTHAYSNPAPQVVPQPSINRNNLQKIREVLSAFTRATDTRHHIPEGQTQGLPVSSQPFVPMQSNLLGYPTGNVSNTQIRDALPTFTKAKDTKYHIPDGQTQGFPVSSQPFAPMQPSLLGYPTGNISGTQQPPDIVEYQSTIDASTTAGIWPPPSISYKSPLFWSSGPKDSTTSQELSSVKESGHSGQSSVGLLPSGTFEDRLFTTGQQQPGAHTPYRSYLHSSNKSGRQEHNDYSFSSTNMSQRTKDENAHFLPTESSSQEPTPATGTFSVSSPSPMSSYLDTSKDTQESPRTASSASTYTISSSFWTDLTSQPTASLSYPTTVSQEQHSPAEYTLSPPQSFQELPGNPPSSGFTLQYFQHFPSQTPFVAEEPPAIQSEMESHSRLTYLPLATPRPNAKQHLHIAEDLGPTRNPTFRLGHDSFNPSVDLKQKHPKFTLDPEKDTEHELEPTGPMFGPEHESTDLPLEQEMPSPTLHPEHGSPRSNHNPELPRPNLDRQLESPKPTLAIER